MLLLSEDITLSTAHFDTIEAFEFKHYKTSAHRDLMVKHIESLGHLPDGVLTVDFVSIYPKTSTLHFQLTAEDGNVYSEEIDVLASEHFQPLFNLVLSVAPAMKALSEQYSIDHIYSLGAIISARIIVGDLETYPLYVPLILPKHVDNYEYNTEDAQMVAMRFTHIGEQRTTRNLLRTPAIARYVVEQAEKQENNGFSEIYPVVLHGYIVEFNSVIQFPHELIIPTDNDTESTRIKELGATFIDAVTVCDAGDVCWMDTVNGKTRPVA